KSFPYIDNYSLFFIIRVDDIVLNIDLAPTFLDMGGVEPPPHMDGRSLLPLLQPRRRRQTTIHWPDTFLVESDLIIDNNYSFFRSSRHGNVGEQSGSPRSGLLEGGAESALLAGTQVEVRTRQRQVATTQVSERGNNSHIFSLKKDRNVSATAKDEHKEMRLFYSKWTRIHQIRNRWNDREATCRSTQGKQHEDS
ncbi:Uncharacterized protein OBRU01_26267, partial [Operophtera brumata]